MADPYYANVSLLLPMNGANNGTVFTDYSPTPKTITRYGGTKTVTAQSKYYGSSGYFDGSGDYLAFSGSSAWQFGTGDFTAEAWVRPIGSGAGDQVLFGGFATNPDMLFFMTGLGITPALWDGTTQRTSSLSLTAGVWGHVAFSRAGGVLKIFVGGVTGFSMTGHTINFGDASSAVYLGANNGTDRSFGGYLQDLRITKGIARYTADFTPPPRMLPGISGTILDTTGTPCARQIYVYNQATGALLASTTSDASTGYYEAFVHPAAEEVFRVVVANEPTLYNNLIDRVFPG